MFCVATSIDNSASLFDPKLGDKKKLMVVIYLIILAPFVSFDFFEN